MLKNSSAYAKVRHYPDSLTQALDRDAVPPAVYDTLIQQTEAHLPTLHRYFRLRAKLLGLDDLHYYDLYVPIVKSSQQYPIADGEKLMLDAVKPLGSDYVAAMRKGRSEEHTSELQSLMRISYAVFCLKKTTK